ncbi:anti-sigma B factor antagonist/stage II sporulation protein AA (anti-sigma F factor antagonist) [Alkalibacillus filiformis]|uniref:Anti-sigma factor antagonist n=1 Tax=Alkalibacillus filiformis TaxID=200990 RepID=A0ABU0DW79_9BACI|nr:STAS domain-containing protein [Alkalibacillus filiformis]MDQ0352526.1 anti-sigma B factor antagonist/stage II sporulation protein AA (anti-sigma F factor antagonist) [Alkalibacillus filiformis]
MNDLIRVEKQLQGEICTLYVNGVLDYSTMDPFDKEIRSIDCNIRQVVVNFENLSFIDSTGLGSIVNLVHEASDKQFNVFLEGINEEINDLFETVGVYKIIESLQEVGE